MEYNVKIVATKVNNGWSCVIGGKPYVFNNAEDILATQVKLVNSNLDSMKNGDMMEIKIESKPTK